MERATEVSTDVESGGGAPRVLAPRTLPRRVLGQTGLELSILGFGASPLGSVFGQIDEDEGVRAVLEAFEKGVNYFDVSPFYGDTRAEQVLGRALKELPRDQFILSTKVGRYGQELFDFSRERVRRSVEESCARLHVDHLDIVLCHDVEFVPLQQIVDETLPALVELRASGKIRFIGISGLPLPVFKWVLTNSPPGTLDVVLSYCHYCLNDDSLLSLLPLLEDKGVGLINASPLAMGLLSPQGPPPWHPASQGLKDACKEAVMRCQEHGVSLPKLALKFSTSKPGITTTLVGMCTREQVSSNINAVIGDLSQEEEQALSEVVSILSPHKNETWPSGLQANN